MKYCLYSTEVVADNGLTSLMPCHFRISGFKNHSPRQLLSNLRKDIFKNDFTNT